MSKCSWRRLLSSRIFIFSWGCRMITAAHPHRLLSSAVMTGAGAGVERLRRLRSTVSRTLQAAATVAVLPAFRSISAVQVP